MDSDEIIFCWFISLHSITTMRSRTEIMSEADYARTFYGTVLELLLDQRDILLDIRDNKSSAGSPRRYSGELYGERVKNKPPKQDVDVLPSLSKKPQKKKFSMFGGKSPSAATVGVVDKGSYWERSAPTEKEPDDDEGVIE